MPQTCPKCSRINPAEALFCFQDGIPLRALDGRVDRVDPGSRPFPVPFVFPSGVTCLTFDQLALACVNDWPGAVALLRQGFFSGFLSSLGREDLAQEARQAARYPDPDRGLNRLLARLPARSLTPAKLLVEPRKINLGQLAAGVDRKIELHLANQGSGLLFGSVSCEETPWLGVGEGQGVSDKVFQFLSEAVLVVQVRGHHLRAANKPLQGRITIQSNGGSQVVQIAAEVPVVPFRDGLLAGARSPRQVAEKAKTSPKEAAVLFEKGAVAAWYKENGWDYPVLGEVASGVAAVQQFFEALGLTAPPKLEISNTSLSLFGNPGEALRQTVRISTPEKRPVYARAVSNRPWLKVAGVRLEGRSASIDLAVPAVPAVPGERFEALVTITSNGNQRFEVPVTLSVAGTRRRGSAVLDLAPVAPDVPTLDGPPPPNPVPALDWPPPPSAIPVALPARSARAIPVAAVAVPVAALPSSVKVTPPSRLAVQLAPAPVYDIPDEEFSRQPFQRRQPSRWKHAIPVFFLVLGLLGALAHDVFKVYQEGDKSETAEHDLDLTEEAVASSGTIELRFHDTHLTMGIGNVGMKPGAGPAEIKQELASWPPTMRFGLVMKDEGKGVLGVEKKLTFRERGLTNNTCVRLDDNEWLFGERQCQLQGGGLWPPGKWPGRWLEQEKPLGEGADGKPRVGRRSVWYYDDEKIQITQTVEVVRGPQTGQPDTCLIRYKIENVDTGRSHKVGLRFLLDTFIGSNDGVPFLIPGKRELCNTKLEFPTGSTIPDFIQALEKEDLTNPGTVAQLQLKVGGGLEPPARVTLGAYPNPRLADAPYNDTRCRQEKTMWEVPLFDIKVLADRDVEGKVKGDSAVTLYWEERVLEAGQSREVGFSYGLGRVAGRQGKGQLALTVGGSFKAGEEFTVTAYVGNPQPDQTVTLNLPDDFELVDCQATQSVPMPPEGAARRISPVTWRISSPRRECSEVLEAKLSTGPSQKVQVKITHKRLFGD
jgi:hypothetical protein